MPDEPSLECLPKLWAHGKNPGGRLGQWSIRARVLRIVRSPVHAKSGLAAVELQVARLQHQGLGPSEAEFVVGEQQGIVPISMPRIERIFRRPRVDQVEEATTQFRRQAISLAGRPATYEPPIIRRQSASFWAASR